MSSHTASAKAIAEIVGTPTVDSKIPRDQRKNIAAVRNFLRTNGNEALNKVWDDLDILQVLQERAEPRMDVYAAAFHIMESAETPERWHTVSTHREQPKKTRGGKAGPDTARTRSSPQSSMRVQGNQHNNRDTARNQSGRGRGGRAASSSNKSQVTAPSQSSAQTTQSQQQQSQSMDTVSKQQVKESAPAPAPAAAPVDTKKPMNFAAAARAATVPTPAPAPVLAKTPSSTPAELAAVPAETPDTKSSSGDEQAGNKQSKQPKRAAKKSASPAPSAAAAPAWKPKRAAENEAQPSEQPQTDAEVVSQVEQLPPQQQPAHIPGPVKVRLPAGLPTSAQPGVRFGGPRVTAATPAEPSSAEPPAEAKPYYEYSPANFPTQQHSAPSQQQATPSPDSSAVPMHLPPGIPPNFYYFYNFMQPGMQTPQGPGMLNVAPDYGLASAALYGAAHQTTVPVVDQPAGQNPFPVSSLGMGLGGYAGPQGPAYGAYGAMPPATMPSQYPQLGMMPPLGMGLPLNMLAGGHLAQNHPAAMQYQQQLTQPALSAMQAGFALQPNLVAAQQPPAGTSQSSSATADHQHQMHHHQHDAMHPTQQSGPTQHGFVAPSVDQNMLVHPYAPVPPYGGAASMPHPHGVDMFSAQVNAPPGVAPQTASLFDSSQQQPQPSQYGQPRAFVGAAPSNTKPQNGHQGYIWSSQLTHGKPQ